MFYHLWETTIHKDFQTFPNSQHHCPQKHSLYLLKMRNKWGTKSPKFRYSPFLRLRQMQGNSQACWKRLGSDVFPFPFRLDVAELPNKAARTNIFSPSHETSQEFKAPCRTTSQIEGFCFISPHKNYSRMQLMGQKNAEFSKLLIILMKEKLPIKVIQSFWESGLPLVLN